MPPSRSTSTGANVLVLGLIAVTVAATGAHGQTTTYIPNANNSGNWHEPARWDNGIPNAPGVNAVLNQPISSTAGPPELGGNPPTGGQYVLSLQGNVTTVGSLTSNNAADPAQSFRTQINNGTLVFDTGSAVAAELNENLGASDQIESRLRINVPVVLNSDLIVSTHQAINRNTHTELVQRVDGSAARTLIKQGLGNLQFAFTGTLGESEGFFGNVLINEGGIRMIIPNGAAPGTLNPVFSKSSGITVQTGAQLQFGNGLSSVTLGPGAELKLNGPGKPPYPGLATNNGALRFDGAGEVVCSFNSPVNLQSASHISVASNNSTGILTAEVRGDGELQKIGGGLLKLTSPNVYSGGTVVANGSLAVNNTVGSGVGLGDVVVNNSILGGTGRIGAPGDASNVILNGGTLAPGDLTSTLGASLPLPQLPNLNTSPGVLNVFGDLTLDSASTMHVDIIGGTLGTGYDQLVASGAINLGGALLSFSLGDFIPAGNETFTLINNNGVGSVLGEFGNYTQGAPVDLAGKTFYINYLGGSGNDVVLSPTEPGISDPDFDNDGDVDGADFLTWQRGTGGAGGPAQGDADGNGQVNIADFGIWKNQFGNVGAGQASSAVPEPASALLVCWLLASGIVVRRRTVTTTLHQE